MSATVHDIHHRNGQDLSVGSTDVFVERLTERVGGGVGGGEGNTEDGVGAEFGFVLGAIELDHGVIDADLVTGIEAEELGTDLGLHVGDGG